MSSRCMQARVTKFGTPTCGGAITGRGSYGWISRGPAMGMSPAGCHLRTSEFVITVVLRFCFLIIF